MPKPLVKILSNVKTLEEIEAELLNNSSANTSLAESTKSKSTQIYLFILQTRIDLYLIFK